MGRKRRGRMCRSLGNRCSLQPVSTHAPHEARGPSSVSLPFRSNRSAAGSARSNDGSSGDGPGGSVRCRGRLLTFCGIFDRSHDSHATILPPLGRVSGLHFRRTVTRLASHLLDVPLRGQRGFLPIGVATNAGSRTLARRIRLHLDPCAQVYRFGIPPYTPRASPVPYRGSRRSSFVGRVLSSTWRATGAFLKLALVPPCDPVSHLRRRLAHLAQANLAHLLGDLFQLLLDRLGFLTIGRGYFQLLEFLGRLLELPFLKRSAPPLRERRRASWHPPRTGVGRPPTRG